MNDRIVIEKTISPTWNTISMIADQVEASMLGKDSNLVSGTVTVLTELIENAVKYGESIPEKKDSNIELHLEIDEGKVQIFISNYVRNNNNLKAFKEHVDKINKTNDPESLYVERLNELMNESKFEESQLGLYRISFEGKFDLTL